MGRRIAPFFRYGEEGNALAAPRVEPAPTRIPSDLQFAAQDALSRCGMWRPSVFQSRACRISAGAEHVADRARVIFCALGGG
jgi:hypothetical protein